MTEQIAAWLTSTANFISDRKGRTGMLKIYTSRTATLRDINCVTLDKIISHTGQSREDIVKAIASLQPEAGKGAQLHVVIKTEERITRDDQRAKFEKLAHRDAQRQNYFVYMTAGGYSASDSLPAFNPEVTVQ